MQGKQVVSNRLLFDKEKMRVRWLLLIMCQEHELHLSRLRNMKSLLDNRTPKQFNHLANGTNAKSKQLMSKYIEQQNENRILLKKMLSIDLKPSILNPSQILLKNTPSSQSLNRISRLKELIRVNQENKVSPHSFI